MQDNSSSSPSVYGMTKTSGPEQRRNDRFTARREIWDMFIANLKI
jgi:hypothetical protein